jgi:hypothetical protein
MRILRSTLALVALLGFAAPAAANTSSGADGVAGGFGCLCGTTLNGAVVCWEDNFCDQSANCDAATPCPAGFACIINECCNNSPTLGKCLANCPDGTACSNPGVCGTFAACEGGGAIPTVSEWGLIIMTGLLLVAGAFLIWKRSARAAAAVA